MVEIVLAVPGKEPGKEPEKEQVGVCEWLAEILWVGLLFLAAVLS
jgi:hypothetical protein